MAPTEGFPRIPPPAVVRIATLGGIGNIPWAPGTFGSLAAVAVVALFDRIPFAAGSRAPLLCLATGIIFGIGVAIGKRNEVFFRERDPGQVVIDEFAGQMLAFVLEPTGSWKLLLGGFIAFRAFDIWKPFPARQAEHLRGGWGIMVDDVIAGLYALIVVAVLSHLLR
jgi:phosphatidylglycerophosphatase A